MKKAVTIFLFFISMILKAEVDWNDYYWEKVPFTNSGFNSAYWLEFYFLPDNPKYGYAVGTKEEPNPGYNDMRGVFAKTTDSGKTWRVSFITPEYSFHAESVMFIDTNIGYCSGYGGLYKTINGGNSWELIYQSYPGGWGHYVIDSNIWIAGASCDKYSSAYNYGGQIMYHSTNEGGSWNSTLIKEENHITDFKMFDKKNGYAIGSGAIFYTIDGGTNWKKLCNTEQMQWNYSQPTNINWHEDLNIHNQSILIPAAPGCSGNKYNGEGGALFSTDFGTSWKTFKTKGSTFGTWLNNDSTGWVCGYHGEVYYTKNYGENWTLLNCGIDKLNMDDLWFINDSTGFIAGANGIYRLTKKQNVETNKELSMCSKLLIEAEGNYPNYEWFEINSSNDTNKIANGKNIEVNNSGKYLLKYSDCKSIYKTIYNVTIGSLPNVFAKTDKPEYCAGDSVVITGNVLDTALNIKIELIYKPQTPDSVTEKIIDGQKIITIYEIDSSKTNQIGIAYTVDSLCYDTIWVPIIVNPIYKPILRTDGELTFCNNMDRTLYLENAEMFAENIWYCNNKIIGRNINSYKLIESGEYNVLATSSKGCSDSSDTIKITIIDAKNVLNIINVDNVCFIDSVNYGKQSSIAIDIMNNGDTTYIINEVFFKYKIAFTAPLSQFPITIPPKESRKVILYYTPTNLNMQYDTLYIIDYCSNHLLPLSGFCLGNIDSSEANCDVIVTISTRSIEQKEIIQLELPAPNPTPAVGKINYKIISEQTTKIEESPSNYINNSFNIQLYDLMGNPLNITFNDIKSSEKINNNQKIQNGEINFNLKNLTNGIYFIKINYGTTNKVFSIIKN